MCIDILAKNRSARSQILNSQGLRQPGLVATMRKLLHAIFGMFKHQQPFDGAKTYALSATQPDAVPQEVACA